MVSQHVDQAQRSPSRSEIAKGDEKAASARVWPRVCRRAAQGSPACVSVGAGHIRKALRSSCNSESHELPSSARGSRRCDGDRGGGPSRVHPHWMIRSQEVGPYWAVQVRPPDSPPSRLCDTHAGGENSASGSRNWWTRASNPTAKRDHSWSSPFGPVGRIIISMWSLVRWRSEHPSE